ncbi:MAG TPA: tail fiber domain-containing protein [Candidatus Limnocylindria bacterium]|nr:tail fiber domain-containing protein [Candidatus Limnocylindria bacterium]
MKRSHAFAAPLRAAFSALLLGACALQLSPALGQATANPPERMTYQGFLVGSDGVALGNSAPKNYDVIFKIYNHETASDAANLLWAEQQTVTVDKGYFNVLLGEGAPTGDPRPALSTLFKGATASDRYVGITVKGIGTSGANVDILPRLRLMTSPYSFLATSAVKLVQDNGSGTDLLTSSGNLLTLSGSIDVTGNNSLEFGSTIAGKEPNAGRIGYQLFDDALDIVGAGTGNNRKVKIFAEGGLTVNGPVSANSFSGIYNGDGSALTGVAKLGGNTFTGYQEVQNDLRVGTTGLATGSGGWGNSLIFSGARPFSTAYNGDNSDPLWMARFNTALNSSELRMVIGDDPGSADDRFVIGTMLGNGNYSQSGTWTPQLAIKANGSIELRPGITKDGAAGTISYQAYSDALDIVGAGTTGTNRKIKLWSEGGLQMTGGMDVNPNGYGLTFRVVNDAIQLFHYADKARYMQMWRYDGGVAIYAAGGGFGNGGGQYARQITWDGDGNWDVSSDRKLKKDIVDAEPMLERALKVQVRRFRWKDATEDAKPTMGVIAQELQPLFPDLVSEQQDPNTKEKNLAVGYSDFGLIAVKAIQELKQQHDAEVADLKAQLAELKAQMTAVLQANPPAPTAAGRGKQTASIAR